MMDERRSPWEDLERFERAVDDFVEAVRVAKGDEPDIVEVAVTPRVRWRDESDDYEDCTAVDG